MKIRVGVDVGGTFTDLVLWDAQGRKSTSEKVLTTPSNPAHGVLHGIELLVAKAGISISEIDQVVHGTTLVTNAVIERKGARTALITTAGCRDVIEIGREVRFDVFDLSIEMPEPLVLRDARFEVNERVADDGEILTPLDISQVEELIDHLVDKSYESVAVCLLFSYLMPRHEQIIRETFERKAPQIFLTISSDLVPEIGEYERTSTALINAYVQPLVDRYLRNLEDSLAELGFAGQILLMLSNGGTATTETARRYPVRLLESGPAAGVLAATELGNAVGDRNLLAFDMGGTTAKACFVHDGEPIISRDFEAARVYRFKQGSGLPVRTSVIEMIEIGAGGGSIAAVDDLGLLKVGPESAGADPGPACYGRGGKLATITDADLILGYLNPDYFLGGSMALSLEGASKAIMPIATELGITVEQAAWGMHSLVNENMAIAARIHAAECGIDIRDVTLTATGGAGPVHAFHVARALGISRVLLPFGAGVASARGLLIAPIAFDFVRPDLGALCKTDWSRIEGAFQEMEAEAGEMLGLAGVANEEIRSSRFTDMRYVGQNNEVSVRFAHDMNHLEKVGVRDEFVTEYQKQFGKSVPNANIEIVNLRLFSKGNTPQLSDNNLADVGSDAQTGERLVYVEQAAAFQPCPVYDRMKLGVGASIQGPAIIEERESTVVLGGGSARVLPGKHLLVETA